ncbi:16861_t:CDS:2 [Racocetra persica]|uniref:16861_t:CDS:1 n=1 Tax=Racocetra persica TaxID=160502 RepID=A0ACA9MIJ4_9GLOM|nr:16861_t:CDS:2 [Racocetra persica]
MINVPEHKCLTTLLIIPVYIFFTQVGWIVVILVFVFSKRKDVKDVGVKLVDVEEKNRCDDIHPKTSLTSNAVPIADSLAKQTTSNITNIKHNDAPNPEVISNFFNTLKMKKVTNISTPENKNTNIFTPEKKDSTIFISEKKGTNIFTSEKKGNNIFMPEKKDINIFAPEKKEINIFTLEKKDTNIFKLEKKDAIEKKDCNIHTTETSGNIFDKGCKCNRTYIKSIPTELTEEDRLLENIENIEKIENTFVHGIISDSYFD